jgi:hypothetical protein
MPTNKGGSALMQTVWAASLPIELHRCPKGNSLPCISDRDALLALTNLPQFFATQTRASTIRCCRQRGDARFALTK